MKNYAKAILADGGVKVFIKDIESVNIHHVTVLEHQCAGGTLPQDQFSHRDIVLVKMKDGTKYEVLLETVDKEGNFSTKSAKMVTREVRKIEGE